MRSLFFEGGEALLKVSYDKDDITPDAVIEKVTACGLSWLNGTIEEPLEKINSCVCSDYRAGYHWAFEWSTMDLYGKEITANLSDCLVTGLKEVCYSASEGFTKTDLAAGVTIVGLFCLACC